jgi:acetyl esterase/lipase
MIRHVSGVVTCVFCIAAAQEFAPVSVEQIRQRVPPGVKYIPDRAYREGNPAWRADVAMPEGDGAARPGIVFIHGGGWVTGDKRMGHSGDLPLEVARRGFVAISVNYRLATEAPMPACIEDVKCAVRWFRAHAEEFRLDPKRVGTYGYSAGAHLVAMLALAGPEAGLEGDGPYREYSSSLQAAAMGGTPTDLPTRDLTDWEALQLFGGPEASIRDRARRFSPITWVRADTPPMLLLHGAADVSVPFSQAERLNKALHDAGARNVTLLRVEGAGHNLDYLPRAVVRGAVIGFFEATLSAAR